MPGWVAGAAGAGNLGFGVQDLLGNQNEAIPNLLCAPSFLPGPRGPGSLLQRMQGLCHHKHESHHALRERMPCPQAGRLLGSGLGTGVRRRDLETSRVASTRAGRDLTYPHAGGLHPFPLRRKQLPPHRAVKGSARNHTASRW